VTVPFTFAYANAASGASSYTASVTTPTQAADTLVVAVSGAATGAVPLAVKDSQGNKYDLIMSLPVPAITTTVRVFECNRATYALTAGTDTVTVTMSGTASAIDIIGTDMGRVQRDIDATASATGTAGTTQSAATGALNWPGGETVLALEWASTYQPTWQSPVTALKLESGNGAGFLSAGYTTAEGAAAVTVSATTATAPPSWAVLAIPYAPAFPDGKLGERAELLINGTWTGITGDLDHGPVSTGRGHPDESTQTAPATLALTLTNTAGKYSSKNPLSPLYPYLMRNVQGRISVPAKTPYLRLEGDADDRAYVNETAVLDITGSIEVRLEVRPSSWQACTLAAKWDGSPASWAWLLNNDGTMTFWWDDGSADHSVTSAAAVAQVNAKVALRVTLTASTGTVTFYTGSSLDGTYTQLGTAASGTGGAATSIATGSAPLVVGWSLSLDNEQGLLGKVTGFRLYNGIGGTVAADGAFTAQAAGTTSWTDIAGSTWQLAGDAEISDRLYRGHFEIPEWPQKQDPSGKTITVAAAGGGLLRRVSQRSNPVQSTMYRAWTKSAASLAAYWPMEDGTGATRLASGTGGPAMYFSGSPALASSSSFDCSDPVPVADGAVFSGQVPAWSGTWQGNQLSFLLDVPSGGDTNGAAVATMSTTGTIATLTAFYYTGGALGLTGWDINGNQLFATGAVLFGSSVNGVPQLVWMSLKPSGTSITYELATVLPDATFAETYSGTLASAAIGAATRVVLGSGGKLTGTALGHCAVQAVAGDLTVLGGPLNAWTGEAAGTRFARLCGEEGYQFRGRGNLTATPAMGVQTAQTITALLQECADADRGVWTELRQQLGFGYVTRQALYNQPAAVTVDYDQNHMSMWDADPLEDDQTIVNDVLLTQTTGGATSRQYAAPGQPVTGGRLAALDPPDGCGTYDQSYSVNLAYDSDLDNLAGWIIHAGTVDQPRFPGIVLDLTDRDLAALYWAVLEMDLADRLLISDPPVWLGPDPVSQLAQQITDSLFYATLTVTVCGVPELPYEVAADGAGFHIDTDGSLLASPASATSASLSVQPVNGPAWSTSAGDVPFDIAVSGERMTVTNVAAGSGGGCRVGAYLSTTALGVSDFTAARALWNTWTGENIASARWYKAQGDFSYDATMTEMVAAGVKICLTLRPAYNPVSAAHLASLTTLMQTLSTAGAKADVTLWHEPYYSGLSASQYIAMVKYYGPVIRQYYPLVFVTSAWSVDAYGENNWYPGDNFVDKVATDFYCDAYLGGANLALCAAPANAATPPKPFGIWELGTSTDPVAGQTSGQASAFIAYVQSYMQARQQQGLANADILWFAAGSYNLLSGAASTFEGGNGSWGASANCSVANSSAQAHTGSASLAMTATASGNMSAGRGAGLTNAIAVTGGAEYTMEAFFRTAVTARSTQAGINWYTSGGTFISSSFSGTVSDSTSAWIMPYEGAAAPSNAAWADLVVQVLSAAASEVHYLDDVLFAAQSADVTVIGFGLGLSQSSDYRIPLWQSLYTALDDTSSPQVFTVTRSVNGVVKAHTPGDAVALWSTPVAGF